MRHRKADKKLNRFSSLRKATMRDIAKSVLLYQSIHTTMAKAKEARKLVDHLVSLGKQGNLHAKRLAFKEIYDHQLVGTLFNEIAPRFSNINGGYTRILSLGNRRGDNAQVVILELSVKQIKEKLKKKTETEDKKEAKPQLQPKADEKLVKSKPEEKPIVQEEKPKIKKEEIKKEDAPKEKVAPRVSHETKKIDKKPPEKFFKGIQKFFKKQKDS